MENFLTCSITTVPTQLVVDNLQQPTTTPKMSAHYHNFSSTFAMVIHETSALTVSHLVASFRGELVGDWSGRATTYIPHKCTPDIWKGEILFAATDQHALPASAEHDIHPPLVV